MPINPTERTATTTEGLVIALRLFRTTASLAPNTVSFFMLFYTVQKIAKTTCHHSSTSHAFLINPVIIPTLLLFPAQAIRRPQIGCSRHLAALLPGGAAEKCLMGGERGKLPAIF